MKTLVTGSQGQLGLELQKLAVNYPNRNFLFVDKEQLDLTDSQSVRNFFANHQFDCVINCAAYTNVDGAEDNQREAEILNAGVPQLFAELCNQSGSLLVHLSTDYVFDGNSKVPYSESDIPNPINHYGKTKLQGDNFIKEIAERAIIFRTSWLYSVHGHNFVKTILRKALKGESLKVVDDQLGTPTYAADLATTILKVVDLLPDGKFNMLYNFTGLGEASWFDFAKTILAVKGFELKVEPAKTIDMNLKAKRPAYGVLCKKRIICDFGIEIAGWKESLKRCLEVLQ